MPEPRELVSRIYLTLDGTEVERAIMQKLASVCVDQHAHLPDNFEIRFNDENLDLLDNGPFDLTKEVEIKAAKQDGEKVSLIKGEITALEPVFGEGMVPQFVVYGYDKTHRWLRETKSKAYLNKKDSELASEIASAAGLQAEVEDTRTVYDHIFQHNQTDLTLLTTRAWRIGYECFLSDGKLYFRKPPNGDGSLTLTWGRDLLSFHPRLSLAEQVDEVIVRGWDIDKQEPVVGKASNGRLYPRVGESKDGATWAQAFGTGKRIIVDQPVISQEEANVIAAARLDEISGAFIIADGIAFRRPELKAGQIVKIEALGERFSGSYLVTHATHSYTAEGLRTFLFALGSRRGLLAEMISPLEATDRWPGVVTAIVTNTDDPQNWGRVKVKFPWLSEDAESDWARVVGIGAGSEDGIFIIPEVDDEVLVSFLHGDFSQPCVLGGFWNGKNAIPSEATQAQSGEKPLVRTWHSKKGHRIAVYDNSDNKVEILTSGGHQLVLDDAQRKITLTSAGGLTLVLDDNGRKISIESQNEIEVKASGNMKIQAGGNLDLEASAQVNIKGAMVNIN